MQLPHAAKGLAAVSKYAANPLSSLSRNINQSPLATFSLFSPSLSIFANNHKANIQISSTNNLYISFCDFFLYY